MPYIAWLQLRETYAPKSVINRFALSEKFLGIQYRDGEDPTRLILLAQGRLVLSYGLLRKGNQTRIYWNDF